MNFRLKTSRVIGIITVLLFLVFVLSVSLLPGINNRKKKIEWVDVATLEVEPEVPEIIEE